VRLRDLFVVLNSDCFKYSFAYVDFATPEAKIAAIALSERPLFGRKLLIKDGMNVFGCLQRLSLHSSSDR